MTTFMIYLTRIRSLRQSWRDKRYHARSSERRSWQVNKRKLWHNGSNMKKKKNLSAMKRCKSPITGESQRCRIISTSYALRTLISLLLLLASQSRNLGRDLRISMITMLATALILLVICSNIEIILMSNHHVNSTVIARRPIRLVKDGKACIGDHHYLCLLNLLSTVMATKVLKPTSSMVQHSIVTMAATQRTQRLFHLCHTTLAFSTLWTSLLRLLSIRPSSRYARVITCILTPPIRVTACIRSIRISHRLAVAFLLLHVIQRRKEIMAQEILSIAWI